VRTVTDKQSPLLANHVLCEPRMTMQVPITCMPCKVSFIPTALYAVRTVTDKQSPLLANHVLCEPRMTMQVPITCMPCKVSLRIKRGILGPALRLSPGKLWQKVASQLKTVYLSLLSASLCDMQGIAPSEMLWVGSFAYVPSI
jgi:hypothetical protein